jgi:NAD(P)-dependent dehydrogenase (short-subunit alcohol dehydrogenase family)
MTAATLFLADDAFSSWITGVVLPVDGDVTAGRNESSKPILKSIA